MFYKFNPIIGRKAKFLKFVSQSASNTAFWSVGASGLLYFLWEYLAIEIAKAPPLPPSAYLGIAGGGLLADVVLRGDEPYKFDSQRWKGKKYMKAAPSHDRKKNLFPHKTPKGKLGIKHISPIENEFELVAYIDFRPRGASVGAHLLKHRNTYKLVFGWQLQPLPSSMRPSEALAAIGRIRKSLGEIPEEETLTFVAGAWRKLPELAQKTGDKLLDIMQWWQRDRVCTQSMLGRRTEKTLFGYATYTIAAKGRKPNDLFDKVADYFASNFSRLAPSTQAPPNFRRLLQNAYSQGFEHWDGMLNSQFGINSLVLTCDELWEQDYTRFNDGPIPKIPFKIIVDDSGYRIEQNNTAHLISTLCSLGSPDMSSKRAVYLPGKDKFVRGCVWNQKPVLGYDDSLESDALAQLFWGSSFINDCDNPTFLNSNPKVWDSEVVVQFTGQSQQEIRTTAKKLEEEQNWSRKIKKSTDDIDSTDIYKSKKTMEASTNLMEGAKAVKVGWMGFVYRDTLDQADRAISEFSRLPNASGYAFPENEYFPVLWQTSLPFSFHPMLSRPMDWQRRLEDLSGLCAYFVPIVCDASLARSGIEFQSEYGNSPYYVPAFPQDRPQRKITIGESGSGKSLLAGKDIVEGWMRDIPTFVIDATQGQVATFKPICDALGGTFFNSRTDIFNLLQAIDFRKIDDSEKLEFAQGLIRDQWKSTIAALAMGGRTGGDLKADYEGITAMLIQAWWEDPDILQRYNLAYDGGFGSAAWDNIPTLRDFVDLAQLERLPKQAQTAENAALLEQYRARLSAFLATESGRRISQSSSIDIQNQKLVVCAIGAVQNVSEIDVLPYVASVLALTTSAALWFPAVQILGDEASELSRFDCFSIAFGGYFSGGRKQGITCQILGQDHPSLMAGIASERIFANATVVQIGKITPDAADKLSLPAPQGLGVPRDVLSLLIPKQKLEKTTKGAALDDEMRRKAFSRWAIRAGGSWTPVRFSPDFFQLAITVNGQQEIAERNECLAQNPDDPLRGYCEYAKRLKSKTIDFGVKYA